MYTARHQKCNTKKEKR